MSQPINTENSQLLHYISPKVMIKHPKYVNLLHSLHNTKVVSVFCMKTV